MEECDELCRNMGEHEEARIDAACIANIGVPKAHRKMIICDNPSPLEAVGVPSLTNQEEQDIWTKDGRTTLFTEFGCDPISVWNDDIDGPMVVPVESLFRDIVTQRRQRSCKLGAFPISEQSVELLKKIKLFERCKASSRHKADVMLRFLNEGDKFFLIRSTMGGNPSPLNASAHTNSVFGVVPLDDVSIDEMVKERSPKKQVKLFKRMDPIMCGMRQGIGQVIGTSDMRILCRMEAIRLTRKGVQSFSKLVDIMVAENPGIDDADMGASSIVMRMLETIKKCSMSGTATKMVDGACGYPNGIIYGLPDCKIHIIDVRNEDAFKRMGLLNTYLDTPSTSRYMEMNPSFYRVVPIGQIKFDKNTMMMLDNNYRDRYEWAYTTILNMRELTGQRAYENVLSVAKPLLGR